MDALMIDLNKIDPAAIRPIRGMNEESDSFKILEHAISQDSQQYPIVIRKLTEEEKRVDGVAQEAEYGIIDGHHRYKIAQANAQDKILATVLDYVPSEERDIKLEDVKMALRMNSAIPMTTLQKGEILYRLIEETGKNVEDLGKELFGLAKSMAYRCLNAYKRKNNILTVTKKREKKLNAQMIVDINEAWSKVPHDEKDVDTNDAEKCAEQLRNIESLEKHLAKLRRVLMAQEGVQDILKNSNETVSTEG